MHFVASGNLCLAVAVVVCGGVLFLVALCCIVADMKDSMGDSVALRYVTCACAA